MFPGLALTHSIDLGSDVLEFTAMNTPDHDHRLITIPISHYCERARWALDHVGIPYREDQHIQLFHWPYAWAVGGKKTVPILVSEEGILTDSEDVVRYADDNTRNGKRLYPDDPDERAHTLALERRFQNVLGVESRRIMYGHAFRWGRGALPYNAGRAPKWELQVVRAGFPLVKWFLLRYLDVNPVTERKANELVLRILDETADRLADGRRFLMGDTFSAADLTFACMTAAVVSPPEYGIELPQPEEFPEDAAAQIRSYRDHPAGSYALRLFREHRKIPETRASAP